jgi:hypothetical protein
VPISIRLQKRHFDLVNGIKGAKYCYYRRQQFWSIDNVKKNGIMFNNNKWYQANRR